jgi:subtilisin-like proprotein convertase family protein/streptogramin lyase
MPYTLRMIASDPASQWTINWGDGNIQTLSGNPSRATHVYTTGQVVRNISATAVINSQTVTASTSAAGADLGAFGNLPAVGGAVFGPDISGDQYSDLYVTAWNGQISTLQAYDGKTGAFLGTLSPQGGFAITLGPDNDLYYCKYGGGDQTVFRYDFATKSVSTFVTPGSGGLTTPKSLAFGHDANGDGVPDLYVASLGTEQILCYDGATGAFLGAVVSNLNGVAGVAFGPDGNLYFTNEWANTVQRYDFATGTVKTFVGEGGGSLFYPTALTFGPDGDLYVVSELDAHGTVTYGKYRVLHFDGTTGAYLSTISSGWGRTDKSEYMNTVVFGPDNNLYDGWEGTPLMPPNGTPAPSCVEGFAGPLTAAASTQLPVTVFKTFQKTYTQTHSLNIPDGTGTTGTSTISVPDAGTIVDVNVQLNITHPYDSDLSGSLTGPNGATSGLFDRIGGSGHNFTNTVLDDQPYTGSFIDTASAPFTGTFRPQGLLGDLNGGPSNGTWTLGVRDWVKGNRGTLNNWSITVTYGIGPAVHSAPTALSGSAVTAPAAASTTTASTRTASAAAAAVSSGAADTIFARSALAPTDWDEIAVAVLLDRERHVLWGA